MNYINDMVNQQKMAIRERKNLYFFVGNIVNEFHENVLPPTMDQQSMSPKNADINLHPKPSNGSRRQK